MPEKVQISKFSMTKKKLYKQQNLAIKMIFQKSVIVSMKKLFFLSNHKVQFWIQTFFKFSFLTYIFAFSAKDF